MSTDSEYVPKSVLHKNLQQIKEQLSECSELVEDFLPGSLLVYRQVMIDVDILIKESKEAIPIRCSCGSFEFEERSIVTVPCMLVPGKGHQQKHIAHRFGYFCIKCGKEL